MDVKLGRLFWEITGDTTQLAKSIIAGEKQVTDAGKAMAKVGGKLSLFVTAPLLGIGAAALKSAADLEQNRVAFETMLGSAEAAQTLLKDIEKFAATTPFQMPGLIEGSKRLLAFGVSAEDMVDTLTRLGNAAGGNQETLDRLVLAYGKLQAKGKASLEELNMFTEAGVPIMKALSEQFGVGTDELFKMISTGRVGFADVDKALTGLTTGTGQFAGLIEKQSKTFSGALSTLKDNLSLAGRALVEGMLPALTDLLVEGTKVIEKFAAMDDNTKKLVLTIAGIAVAIGPVIGTIGNLMTAFTTLKAVTLALNTTLLANPLIAAAAAIAVGVALVAGAIGKVSKGIKDVADEQANARTFDYADTLEANVEKLAAFKQEVKGAFEVANKATGRQKELLRASANELADQYRLFEKNLVVQTEQQRVADIYLQRTKEIKAVEEAITLEKQKQDVLQKEMQARVEKKYVDARAAVLDILESEKTELQKIEEQITLLSNTPWQKGRLETDRLAAIEALRTRQQQILKEEADAQADLLEAELAKEQAIVDAREAAYDEINSLRLDDYGKGLFAIDKQVDAYRDAGVDEVSIAEWKNMQIDALDQALADKQKLRQQEQIQMVVDSYNNWLGLAGDLNQALDLFGENELARMEANGASEEELDAKKKELAEKSFKRKKALSLAQVAIDTASAIIGFLADPGGFAGLALSIGAGAIGIAQAAAIASQPVPALADGGIALPTPGGRTVQVAEGGSAEAIVPLNDQGKEFIQDALATPATGQGRELTMPVSLMVQGFKEMVIGIINVGLQDGTVRVDGRKVTNLAAAVRGAR